jgi:RimJ/RimL family protein N-acetyltransferase
MDVVGRWSKPTIVGELVTLRPLDGSDADAVWDMVNDAESGDLTATTERFEWQQIVDWCASRSLQDHRLDLAVVENATGEFAGEVVLNDHESATDAASFRISLRGPKWYGRGLGTEATRLIVDHGLDVVGLSSITLEVLERNPRAHAVYNKIGFEETRTFDDDGETWIGMRISR